MKNKFCDFINYRGHLSDTLKKLNDKKQLNIVYFGGSITDGFGSSDHEINSWRAKVDVWFKNAFPKATINSINSSIGESGTYLGVYRLQRDILSQSPDLLFIEYAVNDLSHETTRENAAIQFETIVREVKTSFPSCDIVTIITEAQMEMNNKELYPAAQGHEDISKHYNISSILVGKALSHYINQSKTASWNEFFNDSVHPNDNGYLFYYNCIEEFLHNEFIDIVLNSNDYKTKELPEMFSEHLLDGERYFDTFREEMLRMSFGFKYSGKIYKYLEKTPYIGCIYTKLENAEFSFSFYGTEVGIYTNFSHYKFAGNVYLKLDDEEYKVLKCSIHNPTLLVSDLKEGNHTVTIKPIFTEETPEEFEIAALFTRNSAKQTLKNI